MDAEPSPHPISGLHHVTAISGDPAATVGFYVSVLGLRLVKRTVNFDDPGTYHLYFGDSAGSPGTVITFFPWARAVQGQPGAGQATHTAFSVPEGSLPMWKQRLLKAGVQPLSTERAGEAVLSFEDPDGLGIELVECPSDARGGWNDSDVPAEGRIRGFHGTTLTVRDPGPTRSALDLLGFREALDSDGRVRFESATGGPGGLIDLLIDARAPQGRVSRGSVHHVAWRVSGDEAQLYWHDRVRSAGIPVSSVLDRQYFRSIYFREPAGVLFEIATDPPGFTWDEPLATLGTALKLPPWLESRRGEIEAGLPPLEREAGADA